MALWGAASEEEGKVQVNTYFTLIDEASDAGFSLVLRSIPTEGALEAKIPRTRFNFELVSTTRQALFERPLVARKSAKCIRRLLSMQGCRSQRLCSNAVVCWGGLS